MLCNCPSERLKAHEVLRKYILSISSPLQIVLVVTNIFLLYLFTNCMLMPGHPWICQNGVATDGVLDPSVISRLKRFSAMNNLQKLALRVSFLCNFFHFTSLDLYKCNSLNFGRILTLCSITVSGIMALFCLDFTNMLVYGTCIVTVNHQLTLQFTRTCHWSWMDSIAAMQASSFELLLQSHYMNFLLRKGNMLLFLAFNCVGQALCWNLICFIICPT